MTKRKTDVLKKTCEELQALQRTRVWYIKSRNMLMNRLRATVAGTMVRSEDEKLEGLFAEAEKVIKRVAAGKEDHPLKTQILIAYPAIEGYDEQRDQLEKLMEALAKALPVKKWVEDPERRGFSFGFLAIVIGETGDLRNYANPAKVWRRLGCAPHTFGGKTLMGAIWKSGRQGKLPGDEWEEFGYSPRRRSVAFLIGKNIVMQNKGTYRKKFEEAKAKFAKNHPEYADLKKGSFKIRCDRHGALLATKLLLKELWAEWNGHPTEIKTW